MTDNIVRFPGKAGSIDDELDKLIYVCSCGCQSFRIYALGMIECVNCGEDHQRHADGVPPGEWVKKLPNVPPIVKRDDGGTTAINSGNEYSPNLARARVVKHAASVEKSGELVGIVTYHADGGSKSWFDITGDETKQWFIRKLTQTLEFIKSGKPN